MPPSAESPSTEPQTTEPNRPRLTAAFDLDQLAAAIAAGASVPFPACSQRELWESIDAASRAEILRVAEQEIAAPWPALTLSQRLAFERSGSRQAFEAPYFQRRRRLVAVALAHAAAPEQRWADAVVDGVGLLLEEVSWCLPAHDGLPGAERRRLPDPEAPVVDLFAAETGALLAWIGFIHGSWLGDLPGVLERIEQAVCERVLQPYIDQGPRAWWFASMSNWNPWITSNALLCTTLLRCSPALSARLLPVALESLDGYRTGVPADGGCTEGILYWWRSPACFFEAIDVLSWSDPAAARRVFADPVLAKMARYPALTHLGDSWWASFADATARVPEPGPGIDKDQHPPALWHRFARAVGAAESAALAGSFDRGLRLPQSLGRALVSLFDPAWRETAPTERPLPLDGWLPDTELLAATGADGALRVVIKGGHNDEPHNHLDVGSLVVAAGGEPVLIDVGAGQYTASSFTADRYSTWFTQSAFHSLPQIDGIGQGAGEQFRARVLGVGPRELDLDLAGAYPAAAGVVHWWRRLALSERDPASQDCAVEESWQLDRAGRAVEVHLMLAGVPEQVTDYSWRLPGPGGRPRALLHLDAAALQAGEVQATGRQAGDAHAGDLAPQWHLDPIELQDPILRGVWGARIARLTIRVPSAPQQGSLRWRVEAL